MKYLLVVLVVAVSGCSTIFGDRFRDRADDYLTTTENDEATTPDGQPLARRNALPIPELAVIPDRPNSFELPVPQALIIDDNDSSSEQATSLNEYRSLDLNPRIEKDGSGSQILRLDGQFAYAWAAVTEAIAASDLNMTDLNRSVGTYYLEISRPQRDDERGWWARLWGSEPEVIAGTYLLKMNRARHGVYLSLLEDVDKLAGDDYALPVLNTIKQQLEK
ncbi:MULTISPECIES: outer membrane protein assembly factor BamC [unclassified Oceanobacter]|jgi:outer membrane protein assembly factor BamC|uniref:outer membrane protein assembly factor BamC n=1 Tax=unclassified Oceanobacter TaxID=2620260 RepID=UPI0026E3AF67|nr:MULTISPECIES: outer membrane protein assembly factor BamC [unclassified Oceanobacter]MDO6682775.1 outer membrane protein assembly factor BamC [Oceanobacter sp. 5_MG-2023]MDP2504847.1 outer membrane protein assembly factor BamC [Oceanobacter sp. 3_MG-2023]MDP2607592.1 outer membrane protein assembly factor BamC [Oceanobacter sp. 1_MG-2023]MDP2610860.1 outer membrane protein assembly factor BamC [Oceanobacter sp. 2_MG-2023]